MFELHQKWCLVLQLAAEKKTPFLVQLKQMFGPSCFVRAWTNEPIQCLKDLSYFNYRVWHFSFIKFQVCPPTSEYPRVLAENDEESFQTCVFPEALKIVEEKCHGQEACQMVTAPEVFGSGLPSYAGLSYFYSIISSL